MDDFYLHLMCRLRMSDEMNLFLPLTKKSAALSPLCSAVQEKQTKYVKSLLRKGQSVNQKLENGRTPIHFAVESGSCSMVALLITHGANVNERDIKDITPLHLACFYHHTDIVRLLLSKKADIHAVCMMGTPIIAAANPIFCPHDNAKIDIISILIEKGANVNDKDTDSEGALLFAVYVNNVRLTKLLIEAKVNVNDIMGEIKDPILFLAIDQEYVNIIKLFMESENLDVNMRSEQSLSALHKACTVGNLVIVKMLVERKYDLNAVTEDGDTPLHWALKRNNFLVAKYLLEQVDIDVNIQNNDSDLPLHYALLFGGHLELGSKQMYYTRRDVIKTIIRKTENVNTEAYGKFIPLNLAVANCDFQIVVCLLECGANINLNDSQKAFNFNNSENRNTRYFSPLEVASECGNIDVVKRLLSLGAEVNDGLLTCRPLFMAIKMGNFEITKALQNHGAEIDIGYFIVNVVIAEKCSSHKERAERKKISDLLSLNNELLENVRLNNIHGVRMSLEKGASVNVSHIERGTSLTYAAWKGYEDIVDLLLENGAAVNLKSGGYTALHMAGKFHNETNIVNKLLRHGAHYNLKDKRGKTPLQYARKGSEVHEMLEQIHYIFRCIELEKRFVFDVLQAMKYTDKDEFELIEHTKDDQGETIFMKPYTISLNLW